MQEQTIILVLNTVQKKKQTQKQSRMKGEIRLGLHTSPHLPTLLGQGGDVYES